MFKLNPKSKDNSNHSTQLPEKLETPSYSGSPVNQTRKLIINRTFPPPLPSKEEQPSIKQLLRGKLDQSMKINTQNN